MADPASSPQADPAPSPESPAGASGTAAPSAPPSSGPRAGYLHIGPDWRITFAHLAGGNANERTGDEIAGHTLWELYPELKGSPFEAHYRATMEDRQPRTFQAVYKPADIHLENRLYPAGDGIALFYEDVTRRRLLEQQLERRNRQQDSVARLGQAALEGVEIPYLLDQAVHEVASGLDVEFAKIVEPVGDGTRLRMRAGVGWNKGVVGEATVSAEGGSQAAFALQAHGPVIVEDIRGETRFTPPPLFLEHGIISGMSVLVGPRDSPIGVLGAHSREKRRFAQNDLNFLQAVANLLAAALTRNRIETELRSHRDNLEGLVRERTRLLETTNKEIEAFSYTVSHDLRTPLRAIDGFSQLLVRQHKEALPPSAQALLAKVQENAQRMGHLIESLLNLSRLGRKELTLMEVDLGAVANQVLSTLAAAAPDRRVQVEVESDLLARGDADLLGILMSNLLANAWKFSSGRPRARIEVGRKRDVREPTFFVRDNGAGFDMEHAANLFKPFQRLHSASEFEGTGVGLATVHRIVQRHGGRVWAESEPGKGATFWFTLPA
ncbi:MAG TPA: ATP-binding protein [Candidatus Thermoplasmatota archaeon]|nr:ATP-binding protein [Candidatus Thermoplasmatota archaeon]